MALLTTIFVCLAIVLPFPSSAQTTPSCTLNSSGHEMICDGVWPSKAKLQENNNAYNLRSLTIRNTNTENLRNCTSLFPTLHNLRQLDLSSNHISYTRSSSFTWECFPNLEYLSLDDNSLRLNAARTFSGLYTLRGLRLNGALYRNQSVTSNLQRAFKHLQSMPNLTELWLNNNKLATLSPDMFKFNNSASPALRSIHLSNNSLGGILMGTFDVEFLPNLTFLDLSWNRITALVTENTDNLDQFPSLTLNLTGNPFTCDCPAIEPFVEWLNKTNVKVVDPANLTCSKYSAPHVGKSIPSLTYPDLNCTHFHNIDMGKTLKSSYILLITVLGIIGVLALIILFMRRKEIIKLCSQMKQATKETFDTHHTYMYSDINRAPRDTPEHSAVDV